MKTTKPYVVKVFFVLLYLLILRLTFLAAGCWMIYNGWYGCGITAMVLGFVTTMNVREEDGEEWKTNEKEN